MSCNLATLKQSLDLKRLPRHIAVIMDGNGRWAQQRGLPRVEGHREGMNSVRSIIRACGELKISHLTLYAFSTENWKRPRKEIQFLMNLLIKYIQIELAELHRQGVRIKMLGSREKIPAKVLGSIDQAILKTRHNQGLKLNLAFNYGGRCEILAAVKKYIAQRPRPDLNERSFSSCLYTRGLPDPDLLIRTSGEMRISNFLLWQLAYAEIVVSPVLWPDFREQELIRVIKEFQKRERRFGGVVAKHA
jgi:undecaprenyl diphosphate synthase